MAKKPEKEEVKSLLRTPKPKKTLGLKVPEILMPHLELIQMQTAAEAAAEHNDQSTSSIGSHTSAARDTTIPSHTSDTEHSINPDVASSDTSPTSISSMPSDGRDTSQPSPSSDTSDASPRIVVRKPVSPAKDFQKTPNSITRAIDLFKSGKSKHCYDVLYSLTRGAIRPQRSIRIPKTKLMKLSNIGSRVTLDLILADFKAKGLIDERLFPGEHAGSEYEVFTPDEIGFGASYTSQTSDTSHTSNRSNTSYTQNLEIVDILDSSDTSLRSQPINTELSENPKTLFKDFLNDDDRKVIETAFTKFSEAAELTTGKPATSRDWQALAEMIGILTDESIAASKRTDFVSIFGPFAAENLKRRLSKPRSEARRSGSVKETIPKHDPSAEPKFDCSTCFDTGLKSVADPDGEFTWSMKDVPCPDCNKGREVSETAG